MVFRRLMTIVAGAMLCSPPIIAQTFRAGVEVVELDFLALDKKGAPHPDANRGPDVSVRGSTDALAADLGLDGLNDLTGVTGGDFFPMSGRNDVVFDRIARETSAYYLATFNVEEADRTGKPRKIELKATRPGITIRARPTFEAPRRSPILPTDSFVLLPSFLCLLPSSGFLDGRRLLKASTVLN